MGGEIYYDKLAGNSYRFYIVIYRDCFSTGAPYDNPLTIAAFDASGNQVQTSAITFPGSTVLPVVFTNPCVVPPNNTCTERAIYTTTMNLPPINGGYKIAYQRCCRGPNVSNLVDPQDTGLTLEAIIPGLPDGNFVNSSPRYTNYPPLIICANDKLVFNHSATDPDGDQLTYSLTTPYAGATPMNPLPATIPPPPYSPVVWSGGHGQATPLGPGSSVQINPTTGVLTAQPNFQGLYVVGIQVEERRNGVLIGRTVRDFLFRVINCQISLQANLPTQTELTTFKGYCSGMTVQFENNSYGGTNYYWDFGVAGTNADTSNQYGPTYTYPAPGTYYAMLIINRGWPCTDTAFMEVIVNNDLDATFLANDSVCFIGHEIDFTGLYTGNSSNATFQWDFGSNASTSTSTQQNVNNVVFNTPGFYPVYFKVDIGICADDTTINVAIFPPPTIDFELPLDYECLGLNINFIDKSLNAVNYKWDFGDPSTAADTSNLANPSWYYTTPGIHTVTLSAGSTGLCYDTISYTFEVYDDLNMAIQSQDSLCITDNSFDFIGNISGPDITTYSWNFTNQANPSASSDTNVFNVVYAQPGNHLVGLTGSYLQCVETVTKSIYVHYAPTVDFAIPPGPQCLPYTANFINNSTADTPLYYEWDFGNGQQSTTQNPIVLYDMEGQFPVRLTIRTDRGCVDTLTLVKPFLVDVKPRPIAKFSIENPVADICNSEVRFIDESIGADIISYNPGEKNIYAFDVPALFTYNYLTSGSKTIIHYAENEYGCGDSDTGSVYIEPFNVFVPNAFTPDGDQFNNEFGGVSGLDANEWHLKIYNRWGSLVFETHDQTNLWDGTFKGEKMPDGVYAYILDIVSCGEEDKYQSKRGHVVLLR